MVERTKGVEIEVVNHDSSTGTARRQDLERPANLWTETNPHAAERAATFISSRALSTHCDLAVDVTPARPRSKAPTSVPDLNYTITDTDSVADELVSPSHGMSALNTIPGQGNNKPARYFLSTRLTPSDAGQ
jgi:hypothetical protein